MEDPFDQYRDELDEDDLAAVPEHLRDLVPLAVKWGMGDDVAKEEFEKQATQAEKLELQSRLRGRTEALQTWLDWAHQQTPAPFAACSMTYMLEALAEMDLWPD